MPPILSVSFLENMQYCKCSGVSFQKPRPAAEPCAHCPLGCPSTASKGQLQSIVPWRILVVTDAETLHPTVVRTPKWRQTGLCHDQPSDVLVLFSKLSIQRDFVIKSCSFIFLVFTSLLQRIDPPLSLRYIHSTFPELIRGLLTVPLALQSCQAVKEESAAASSAIDLTRVCGQQCQPPLWGCDTEISELEKHLLHLPSCLGGCGSCHLCPVHPSVAQHSWKHQAPLEKLPGMSASSKLCWEQGF